MSERSLQTIVETEPECVKVVAPDGTVARMNRAGLDMVEAERPEQVIGHPVMGLIAPEWREEFQALHRRVISGEACTLEFEIVGLKGGHRWLETHAVPLRDTNGQVSGHLAVTRDVTQRRQTEDALREATRKAEAANIAKSRFLATMSHEIRTPLNGILGMAQLLLVPGLREDEREDCVRTILGSGQTLLTLLNDILDLSKVDAGKLSLSSEAFSPAELIEATIALHGEAAESHGISLTGTWGGPATQWYRGDPVRIRQMLSNLVSNAIKFTDAGSVRVEGREASRSEGKATLVFEVADTGIGIPEDQRNQLFQPFTQLDGTATRRHGGTGLGLSIVRRLAEMMGGSVGVESIEGQGSTFRFSILIDLADVATPVPTDDVANPGVAPSIPSARILVVEDNDTNRLVVETYLRKHGYTVLSATDGRAALDLVSGGTRPHLILMDCQMPVMDGFAATEAIRAWENETGSPRLPIVALTAGAFQEDRQRCMACGMDDFLTKPITFATLEAMLIKWLPPA
jgi:PAS domain S-box-containing protein